MGDREHLPDPPTHRVGGRELHLVEGAPARTVSLGEALAVAGDELAVAVDRSRWRHHVDGWRYTLGSQDDAAADRGFDDSAWRRAPHLHVIHDAVYGGHAWFRHAFELPAELEGAPLTMLVGGRDDEDWQRYDVFLNGAPVAGAAGSGVWRDAHRIELEPGHPAPRFGEVNVLAVRTEGLRRALTPAQRMESEHYFFQGWLLDQVIAVGDPRAVVDTFVVAGVEETGEELRVTLRSDELTAELRYAAEDGVLTKDAVIRNDGDDAVTLLEVRLEALAAPASRGGRGTPVFGERLFAGIEHPAAVNQGGNDGLALWQLPGVRLAAGDVFTTERAVIGVAEDPRAAFLERVRGFSARGEDRVTPYSALGWYDFTNPADPLPELTEALAHENLDDVAALGAPFDVWMIDDWWSAEDLGAFRSTFPSGGPALGAAIAERGLAPGLWWATTRGLWTAARAPGMERALAGGIAAGADAAVAIEGAWSWNEEFATMFLSEERYCPAAEPYRGYALEAIPKHARELGLRLLKLDCATLHCTSSEHGHLPGIYSVEPIMNALIDVVGAARAERPDLWVVWYWGFRSPYWLRFGDLVFDKGLKLEAASPASAPAWSARQSVSLNVDQSVEHAAGLLPLEAQDSLGVWLGNVAWANYAGTDEWRDALLLDLARGSRNRQLWGDVTLLDEDDRAFLRDVLGWAAAPAATHRIGANPWDAEPYGYRHESAVTLFNPTFFHRPVPVELGDSTELYPVPGARGDTELAPFETRVVELGTAGEGRAPLGRPTRRVELPGLGDLRGPGSSTATAELPDVARGDHLVVLVRLLRDGQWWYHPDARELVALRVRMAGIDVPVEVVPRVRSRNGPGSPWIRCAAAGGARWSGASVTIDLRSSAPEDVELIVSALVFDPWWLRHPRRFAVASTPSLQGSHG